MSDGWLAECRACLAAEFGDAESSEQYGLITAFGNLKFIGSELNYPVHLELKSTISRTSTIINSIMSN